MLYVPSPAIGWFYDCLDNSGKSPKVFFSLLYSFVFTANFVILTGECTKLSPNMIYQVKRATKKCVWPLSVVFKFYWSLLGNEPASDNTKVCKYRSSTTGLSRFCIVNCQAWVSNFQLSHIGPGLGFNLKSGRQVCYPLVSHYHCEPKNRQWQKCTNKYSLNEKQSTN